MILLVDNYDSFVFNLQRYLRQLGQPVQVLRNNDPRLLEDLTRHYSAIVLSPGPKSPREAGHSLAVVQEFSGRIPILGVCLGHQVIYQAFGGRIVRAIQPIHGKSTPLTLAPSRLFEGIPDVAYFARYHSLVGAEDSLPACLKITAWSAEGEIMAVEHREHPTFGVQFHPESVLSLQGHLLLSNFLHCAAIPTLSTLPEPDLENLQQIQPPQPLVEASGHTVVLPR